MYVLIAAIIGLLVCTVGTGNADQLARSSANAATLVHLHVIWRHGNCNPSLLMPNDLENGPETWPEGLGELTRLGVEQQFHLGELIRRRYANFLPTNYSASTLYVRSADQNKTLMSAQALLTGLFPRSGVNSVDQLQPVPVHTVPFDDDIIDCPSLVREEERVYQSPVYKELEQKYTNVLALIGQASGLESTSLAFKDVWKVYDSVHLEFLHSDRHQMPSWIDRAVLWQISQAYEKSVYGLYDSDILKRLRAGPIMGDILERMQQKVNKMLADQKLYAYSGYSTTVASVLLGFGIKPSMFPPFSTALMIELHREASDNNYMVRLFYRNSTENDDVYELDILDCPFPCNFDRVSGKLRATLVPEDWKAECALVRNDTSSFPYLFFIFFLVSVAVILALVIVFLQLYQIKTTA